MVNWNSNPPRPGFVYTKKNRTRVAGTAAVGGEFFHQQETQGAGPAGFEKTLTTDVAFCASCNALIHEPAEAGAMCDVCGNLICKTCSALKCAICGRSMCRVHSKQAGQVVVCTTHGFFETLGHVIFGR